MTVESEVLSVNDRFYRALTELELEAMSAVWLHEDWVRCVHPGREMLCGWEAIGESWRAIFESTAAHVVEPARVKLRIMENTAWISCIERITARGTIGFSAGATFTLEPARVGS